ncbi:MAG: hypothetical protein QM541_04695 [Flavobacterium sp.]|nr:hypothetical protein [Flavobacterium sp.]
MTVEYINRRKESHFLIPKITKKGNERYYIIKDKSKFVKSDLLIEIPRGFEFYEFPEDAKVVLRKILKSIVTKDEIEIIDEVMKKHLTVKDYLIDKTENSLIVYLGHLDKEQYKTNEEYFLKFNLIGTN